MIMLTSCYAGKTGKIGKDKVGAKVKGLILI